MMDRERGAWWCKAKSHTCERNLVDGVLWMFCVFGVDWEAVLAANLTMHLQLMRSVKAVLAV